jgi:manganese efflux pump family protein
VLAVSLAADAGAVAIATAIRARQVPLGGGLAFAGWCGLFQGIMPVIGYAAAWTAGPWLATMDHWLAFIVLGGIGVRLTYEGLHAAADTVAAPWPGQRMQMSLAFATSIDALVAGVTLPALDLGILWPALVIGGITLVLVFVGAFFGRYLGVRIGQRAEVVGGILLIAIGTRILVSHLAEAGL